MPGFNLFEFICPHATPYSRMPSDRAQASSHTHRARALTVFDFVLFFPLPFPLLLLLFFLFYFFFFYFWSPHSTYSYVFRLTFISSILQSAFYLYINTTHFLLPTVH